MKTVDQRSYKAEIVWMTPNFGTVVYLSTPLCSVTWDGCDVCTLHKGLMDNGSNVQSAPGAATADLSGDQIAGAVRKESHLGSQTSSEGAAAAASH